MFNTQSARNLVDEHLPPGTEPPSVMSSTAQFLRRNWAILSPASPAKASDALRFGLLGASNIAPMAVIAPAKDHPEVIIAAVAARDEKKAQAYAKKHGIPIVHKSYQDLLDDPSIDVIYNALPNSLHFEWALKALKAGKHVLLEKPSASNADEAALLFHHELLKKPNAPILLEAFHARFHPAWQTFMSLLDPQNITSAHSSHTLFKGWFPNDDIRFKYDLSGGTLMDFGTYNILAVRDMMRAEPEECVQANPRLMPKGFDQDCDHAFKAQWRFPNGGTAGIEADLAATGGYPLAFLTSKIPSMKIPQSSAVHKEVLVEDEELGPGQQHFMAQTVTFYNHLFPQFWHRIDIEKVHTIRNSGDGKIVRKWTTKEYKKAYTWSDKNQAAGQDSWTTYRYMLEQFVNGVRGRKGSGVWMDGEESIKQMAMIDSAYAKAGMKLRPTSTYK